MFDHEDYSDLQNEAMDFAVIAIDETEYWEFTEGEAPKELTGILALYLICKGERTHICSLTPSTRAVQFDTVFMGLDYDTHGDFIERMQGIARESYRTDYLGFVDPERIDSRLIADDESVNMAEASQRLGIEVTNRESYLALRDAVWDEVEGAVCQNPTHPSICWDEVWEQYQHEQTLKRRALNVPPLKTGESGQLPLFVAAARDQAINTYEQARPLGWV